ncbi:GNAT family N-acetyltransferase [Hymenobacter ginsengisoli]|uniref:GNAT family N-acetyltransferase n=1 Tax=Hymenobacter ginsengisoli TaxID=1051626 RepID=A0ABP8QRH0_9BACT|nr:MULTISPECIES: GNAT family N-acetyltransferase [unclassified Hymenobacter]MBO2032969.1 GNAT family N-acetyltransferase [Hymenobacter sp. BT559]
MSSTANFPQLTTSRLRLRAFALADVPHLVALAGNYEVAKNTLNIPHPYGVEDARRWVQLTQENIERQTGYAFAIELQATGEFIGGIGLTVERRFDRAEAGYWLGQPYWGQGLASEALAAVLRFGFEKLALNKIYATHIAENPASGRVMLKNGMVKEGELAQHAKRDGRYYDLWQYRLTRAEYAAQQADV